jgi:multisubunit Na+/H+ antiporter MnhB subunit
VTVGPLIDWILALMLLALAWRMLSTRDLFQAVVLFISFGLLMALVWARMSAPDLALADAAIGAGVTGALFLAAYGALRERVATRAPAAGAAERLAQLSAVPLCGALAGIVLWARASSPTPPPVLGPPLPGAIEAAAATSPVTAVLLDLRAWDTLLEVGVLLVALVGAWSLRRVAGAAPPTTSLAPSPLLTSLTRLIVPVAVLLAGYLWWAGSTRPGGAFQAGSVLAASLILLLLAGRLAPERLSDTRARAVTAAALWLFVLAALAPLPFGRPVLDYPESAAYALVLVVEAALTLAIGLILGSLFVDGSRTLDRREDARS